MQNRVRFLLLFTILLLSGTVCSLPSRSYDPGHKQRNEALFNFGWKSTNRTP